MGAKIGTISVRKTDGLSPSWNVHMLTTWNWKYKISDEVNNGKQTKKKRL